METLYQALRAQGYTFDAEYVSIHQTPVQFIPAYNPLAQAAVQEAILHEYEGASVRVIRPEHLIALAFQTGGRHQLIRAEALLEEDVVDAGTLETILATYGVKCPT